MNVIEIRNLTHRFPDGTVGLDDVSLSVPQGRFVVVAGANGSGKTTLLRHLNGLLLPQEGTVRVMGESVPDNPRRARQIVGMVFQDPDSQIVGETVYDDAAFGPENLSLPRDEIRRRVAAALEAVGLAHRADHRPHVLSGGEKRRLAIAGVLAMNPDILVFDEPFSNLDYPGVRQVLGRIVALHRQGRTILVTTHELEKVVPEADRLVIMQHGRIVRDGPPSQLLKEVEQYGIREPIASRVGLELRSWLS